MLRRRQKMYFPLCFLKISRGYAAVQAAPSRKLSAKACVLSRSA